MRARQRQVLKMSQNKSFSQTLIQSNDVGRHYCRLYILGESHTLPLLWQWLTIQHRWYHCTPVFISGLKAYHFRYNTYDHERQQQVYEKADDSARSNQHDLNITAEMIRLSQHQKLIPLRSLVLVVAGEIDCRLSTGMLLAVTKGKYANEDEAIRTTVRAYVDGLCQLSRDRQAIIFVSPVRPPVLTQLKVKKSIKAKRNQRIRLQKMLAHAQHNSSDHNDNNGNNAIDQQLYDQNNRNRRNDIDMNPIITDDVVVNKNNGDTRDDSHEDDDDQLNTVANVHRYALLIRTFNRALIREIQSRNNNNNNNNNNNTQIYYLNIYWQLCKGYERTKQLSTTSASLVLSSSSTSPSMDDGDADDVLLMDLTCTSDASCPSDYLMAERYTLEGQHCNALIVEIIERVLTLTVQRTSSSSTSSLAALVAEYFSLANETMLPPPDEQQRQLNEERAKRNQEQLDNHDVDGDDHVGTGIIMT